MKTGLFLTSVCSLSAAASAWTPAATPTSTSSSRRSFLDQAAKLVPLVSVAVIGSSSPAFADDEPAVDAAVPVVTEAIPEVAEALAAPEEAIFCRCSFVSGTAPDLNLEEEDVLVFVILLLFAFSWAPLDFPVRLSDSLFFTLFSDFFSIAH